MPQLHPIDLITLLLFVASIIMFLEWQKNHFDLKEEKSTLLAMTHWGKFSLLFIGLGVGFILVIGGDGMRPTLFEDAALFLFLSVACFLIGVPKIFPQSIYIGRLVIFILIIAFFLIKKFWLDSPIIRLSSSVGFAVSVPLSAFIDAFIGFMMIANPDLWKAQDIPTQQPLQKLDLKKNVISLIRQNDLEGGIQALFNGIPVRRQDIRSELTIILQRLSEIKERERKGMLLPNEAMVERTRISQTLIDLLKKF